MVEAILYQSLRDSQSGNAVQQLSNLVVDGLSTAKDAENTDHGILYGSFIKSGSNYVLSLYGDQTRVDLVASGSATAPGILTLSEQNDSGITGTANFITYTADDSLIKAVCLLSADRDIPMNNLEVLSDYDADNGFAWFHERAFEKIKEFIQTRYGTQLWNSQLIDVAQINGGLGGFDLSKVLNWQSMKDASRYYCLALIAEKQDVEEGTFSRRAKQAKEVYKGFCQTVEIQLDLNSDRVPDRVRSLSSWKVARGG